MTEAKSTPNTRANSLVNVSGVIRQDDQISSRILRNDFSMIDHFHADDHALEEVLENAKGVFWRFTLPQRRQAGSGVVRDPVILIQLAVGGSKIKLTSDVEHEKRHSRKCIG